MTPDSLWAKNLPSGQPCDGNLDCVLWLQRCIPSWVCSNGTNHNERELRRNSLPFVYCPFVNKVGSGSKTQPASWQCFITLSSCCAIVLSHKQYFSSTTTSVFTRLNSVIFCSNQRSTVLRCKIIIRNGREQLQIFPKTTLPDIFPEMDAENTVWIHKESILIRNLMPYVFRNDFPPLISLDNFWWHLILISKQLTDILCLFTKF